MPPTDSSATAPHHGKAPVVIAVILSVFALHLGAQFFIPIAMALLLHAVLRRPVRALEALHVPSPVGALIVVTAVIVALSAAGWALADPVRGWVAKAPASMETAYARLRTLRRPVERLAEAAAGNTTPSDSTSRRGRPAPAPPIAAPQASATSQALGTTTVFLGGLVETVLLLYLLLSSGDMFRSKLLKMIPARGDKRTAIDILHLADRWSFNTWC